MGLKTKRVKTERRMVKAFKAKNAKKLSKLYDKHDAIARKLRKRA